MKMDLLNQLFEVRTSFGESVETHFCRETTQPVATILMLGFSHIGTSRGACRSNVRVLAPVFQVSEILVPPT